MIELLRRLMAAVRGRRRGAPASATSRLGALGERAAAEHLRGKGYRILERNFRIPQGEIDLIAFRDGVVAFVEVRSVTQPSPLDPLHTVTRGKQRRVIKAAQAYAAGRNLGDSSVSLRFDVVTIAFDDGQQVGAIRHLEGAFHETPRGFS